MIELIFPPLLFDTICKSSIIYLLFNLSFNGYLFDTYTLPVILLDTGYSSKNTYRRLPSQSSYSGWGGEMGARRK